MKSYIKRISAGLLALFMVLSLVPVFISAAPASNKITTTATGYDEASDVSYSKHNVSGKQVIANWGARGEDCVFLSTYAEDFYTGEYTFDSLSSLSGGSSQSNASSSQLYKELQELLTSTHTFYTYYDGNKNVRNFYKYTDCVSNDTSKVALLYRGGLETSNWNSGNIWNQEHVWPQSKLSSSEQIGDIMHLRPANPSENSSRGNTAYGEGSGYYDPGISVRGDCARMVLYMYVRWGKTNTWGSGGVMQSADVLLDWMAEDPVDTWEMGRNDSVQSITGTRNVFVDYPELAWLLFGQDVPAGITTPSDNGGLSANPGGNTPPVTQPPVTQPPVTQPPVTQPPVTQPPVTQPPVTQPPVTQPPVTQPPVTQPPVTQPPVTQPSGGTTTPPASQPGTSEGTQTSTPSSTPATKPVQPAPMATNPVNPDDFLKDNDDDSSAIWVIIVVAIVITLLGGGAAVWFFVIKPKKTAAAVPAEDAPAEDVSEEVPAEVISVEETPVEETPVEEVVEDTPAEPTEENE